MSHSCENSPVRRQHGNSHLSSADRNSDFGTVHARAGGSQTAPEPSSARPVRPFAVLMVTLLIRVALWLIGCVIVHEVGHLIAGLAVGWEFRYFLAGPFAVVKRNGRIRFRFLLRREIGDGRVQMVPKSHQRLRSSLPVLARSNELPSDERRAYFSEAAFFQGAYLKNPILARAWLEEARRVKVTFPDDEWEDCPRAAIALAEGDMEAAKSCLHKTIEMLHRDHRSSGTIMALRSRLAGLLA